MVDFKLNGSTELPANTEVGTMLQGLGFPLRQVDGDAIDPDSSEVLVAESFSSQQPVGLDTPLQVEFGPAVGGPADPIQIDANGLLTINQNGTYLSFVTLYPSRTSSPGVAFLFLRGLKNGVQDGNPVVIRFSDDDNTVPLLISVLTQGAVGDEFTVEIYRDSLGINDGGLDSFTSSIGWGPTPSARIRTLKI